MTNLGGSLISVTSVAVSSASAISRTSAASFNVAASGVARIDLRCNAASGGTFIATVTITHNAATSPDVYTIRCTVREAVVISSGSPPGSGTYGSTYTHVFVASGT